MVSNIMDMSVVENYVSVPDFRRPNYGVIGVNILEEIPL